MLGSLSLRACVFKDTLLLPKNIFKPFENHSVGNVGLFSHCIVQAPAAWLALLIRWLLLFVYIGSAEPLFRLRGQSFDSRLIWYHVYLCTGPAVLFMLDACFIMWSLRL